MTPDAHMQGLLQEKTPFPFSFAEMADPVFDRHISNSSGDPASSELPAEIVTQLLSMDPAAVDNSLELNSLLACQRFHLHDHCQITQCLSGEIMYFFGASTITLHSGDIVLINALTPHAWLSTQSNSRRLNLGFYPHALRVNPYSQCFLPYFKLLFSQHHPFILIDSSHTCHGKLSHCLNEIATAYRAKNFAYDVIIHNYLVEILVSLIFPFFQDSHQNVRIEHNEHIIQKALSYIDQNLSEELGIQKLANYVGLNPSYFSFWFKKHIGIPYKKYITTQRITRAASLLRNTDQPITQILFSCGFSSVSAFYQAFQQTYVISPAQFRKLSTTNAQDTSSILHPL